MGKLKIKTGDIVKVITGDHKGSEGKVLSVFSEKNKAIVNYGSFTTQVNPAELELVKRK